jgi:H+/Cl- antiporter ClcA
MNPTIAHAPMSRAVKVVTITGDVSTFLPLASSCLASLSWSVHLVRRDEPTGDVDSQCIDSMTRADPYHRVNP